MCVNVSDFVDWFMWPISDYLRCGMGKNRKYYEKPIHTVMDSFQIDSGISIASLIER